jgi:hypothetical protein
MSYLDFDDEIPDLIEAPIDGHVDIEAEWPVLGCSD